MTKEAKKPTVKNGKGSTPRNNSSDKFRSEWERIFRGKKK